MFCKELILQYFDKTKPIRVETNKSKKIIEGVYVSKILLKIGILLLIIYTKNTKLLVIVKRFKTWHYYLEEAVYTTLVLTDYNN